MKKAKSKMAAACVVLVAALMLASCGFINIGDEIADAITQGVATIVEEVTVIAIDEMPLGEAVLYGFVAPVTARHIEVSLITNSLDIQFHDDDPENIRVTFYPPSTGDFVTPEAAPPNGTGRLEIAEPRTTTTGTMRGGLLRISLPRGTAVVESMNLRATNGAVRIAGDGTNLANSVEIIVSNGAISLQSFEVGDILTRTTNGTISAVNLAASTLELRSTNGLITLRDSAVTGDLTARTTNGGVTLENVEADMDRADVGTVNGHVTIR